MTELGSLHLKAGRTTQARESLETALRLDRRSFAAYFHLGEYYRDRKEWDKAVESFENARHDRDLRPSALLNLGRCYRAKEMGKNAIETLERLASEWESDPYYSRIYPSEFIAEARYELAEVYLYDKDYQNALDQWQIIIALIPEFRDVAAKVRANARFGRDRVQDFLITPVGEFERIGLFAMAMVGYGVESRRIEGGERMFLSVRETGKIRGRRLFVAIYRTNNPVGETLLADFDRHMKESGLAEGEVYSATGFTASGMKFVLDRPIRLYGKGQMMKFLKAFENRFHGKT
jgi:tetratricopeptide (TPR) repeat protein